MKNNDYYWYKLIKTRGLGSKRLISIAKAIDKFQIKPEDLVSADIQSLIAKYPDLKESVMKIFDLDENGEILQEYSKLKENEVEIIYPGHNDYPNGLIEHAEKFDFSPVLFIKGMKGLLLNRGYAIAGSRNISKKGADLVKEIAADFASEGENVISGYAKGVDSEAHIGALQADGTTTMVLSYGIYEFRIKKDFRKFDFKRDVLIISQFEPNTKWASYNAMLRNRLVCALSNAVIIIESGPERDSSGKMSGTFNAGKVALKMNKPVFVVDPDFFDIPPKGNQDLIKLGCIKYDPTEGVKRIIKHCIKIDDKKPESALQISLFS